MEQSGAKPFQAEYPDDVAHCFGCGRLNERGHGIESYWDGDETVARYAPEPYHTAIPGYVYGGLIASLIDCHGTGTAAAVAARAAGWELGVDPVPPDREAPRYVTASLKVEYRRPTPLGPELEIRGRPREPSERKVVVDITVSAEGTITAEGTVVAVPMPESLKPASGD